MTSSRYLAIYTVVEEIPRGRVSTYGTVARLAGLPGRARQVGYALHALPESNMEHVPWQRVVNAQGRISLPDRDGLAGLQRSMLEHEGVVFGQGGRIDLEIYGWRCQAE